jgi:hypothetical protein
MPRRSMEAMAVVTAPVVAVFPAPPAGLNPRQQEIFRDIVHSRPADYFDPCGLLMLGALARHAEAVERVSHEIDVELESEMPSDDRLVLLARMRSTESSAMSGLGTRLRLTNQSRISPTAGRSAAEKGARQQEPKPWDPPEPRTRKSRPVTEPETPDAA